LNVELKVFNAGTARIEIFNSQGQVIFSKPNLSLPREEIDVRSWPHGIYFIKINTGNLYNVKKLLLE